MQLPDFLKPLDIEKEKEEILKILKSEDALKEYTPLELDCLNILTNAFLLRLSHHITQINYLISQNYIDYAQGEFLDELVKLAGIERLKGSNPIASAEVIATNAVFLPKNARFYSDDGHYAYLNEDMHLKAGSNIIYLTSDEAGSFKPETLELNTPAVKSIKILSDFIIYESKESDEELKKRFFNALTKPSTAGSDAGYKFLAKKSGVKRLLCKNNGAGEVLIIYEGEEALKEVINEALKENVPITDSYTIKKAEEIKINLQIALKTTSKADLNAIYKAIEKNINTFFQSLDLGEIPKENKLISLCFVNKEILDVNISPIPSIELDNFLSLNQIEFTRL